MRSSGIFLLLLYTVCLLGCGKKKEDRTPESKGIEICFKEKIHSLDPRVGISRPSTTVIRMLFEGLMRLDVEGNVTHGLAERYEISEDRKIYTFYLRPCHWSNGDPITAYDFEFAWKRSIDPKTAQASSSVFYPIKNTSRCLEGKSKVEEVGITALTDRILVVELEHPAPYFLELTTASLLSPIPKKLVLESQQWANPGHCDFVSSGPFRLRKWKRGQELVIDRNPFYWNSDDVKIPQIKIHILHDEQDQLRLFEEKKIDWLGQPLSPFSAEGLEGLTQVEHKTALGLLAYFCNVNCYPLNNKNLRKSLAFAIDRSAIANYIFYEGGTPAQALLNPLLFDRGQKVYFNDHDRTKAALHLRAALTELGMDLKDLPEIVLSYPKTPLQYRVAHEIQKQWKETLGISVKLDPLDKPRFFDLVSKGEHQIASSMWKGLLLDPIHMLETMGSTLDVNILTYWQDREFTSIIDQLRLETDEKKKQNLIGKAEAYLIEEMPIIPICFGSVCYSKNQRLKNVYVSPLFRVDFTHAYLVEDCEFKREVP